MNSTPTPDTPAQFTDQQRREHYDLHSRTLPIEQCSLCWPKRNRKASS